MSHGGDAGITAHGAGYAMSIAERRLYHTASKPYEDPATRDQVLAAPLSAAFRRSARGP